MKGGREGEIEKSEKNSVGEEREKAIRNKRLRREIERL